MGIVSLVYLTDCRLVLGDKQTSRRPGCVLCNRHSGVVDPLALTFGDCRGESSSQASDTRLYEFFLDSAIIHLSRFSPRTLLPFSNRNCSRDFFIVSEAKYLQSIKMFVATTPNSLHVQIRNPLKEL